MSSVEAATDPSRPSPDPQCRSRQHPIGWAQTNQHCSSAQPRTTLFTIARCNSALTTRQRTHEPRRYIRAATALRQSASRDGSPDVNEACRRSIRHPPIRAGAGTGQPSLRILLFIVSPVRHGLGMKVAADAWNVVQIAELVRASETVLLRALRILDVDARAAMPVHARWALSAADLDELRAMVFEHAEIAERLRMIAEQLPARELLAVYDDVAAGAATALANGILDPATVRLAARALGVRRGWAALADALGSTDVRSAWLDLTIAGLLKAFRDVDPRMVTRLVNESAVDPALTWAAADDETIRRVVGVLRSYAEQA